MGKKARRQNNKHKSRLGHAIKSNLTGEKLSWFLGHIDEERKEPLTPKEFEDLMTLYLQRFDEELEQIALRQSISKNRAKQHVAREDVIKITLEKEKSEYYGGGIGKKLHNFRNMQQVCVVCLQIMKIISFLSRTLKSL